MITASSISKYAFSCQYPMTLLYRLRKLQAIEELMRKVHVNSDKE